MKFRKYTNYIILVFLVLLSIFAILNGIGLQDDIITLGNNTIKYTILIISYIATIQYVYKIISRLNIKRRKLLKSKLYIPKDITQIFLGIYRKELVK